MGKMASIAKFSSVFLRNISLRALSSASSRSFATHGSSEEIITHTGQKFEESDYRKARFVDKSKLVNTRFAIDLIAEDPVVVCEQRVVFSDSKGPLGHPRVYINLDKPGVHTCGYSGRKFIHKKFYNEAEHGPSVTYADYTVEMDSQPKDYPM